MKNETVLILVALVVAYLILRRPSGAVGASRIVPGALDNVLPESEWRT
jgi:hypothetical protein